MGVEFSDLYLATEARLHAHYGTNTKPYFVDYKSICSSTWSDAVWEGVLGFLFLWRVTMNTATYIKENT